MRELLVQAAVNQVATSSASKTRTAVSSLGPLRDVKRAERMVARTLRIRLRGVMWHLSQSIGPRRMHRRAQRLQGQVLCRRGQSASRRRARGQRPRARMRVGRMHVRRHRGQGVQWQREGGRNKNGGVIAVGWVVVFVLLASADVVLGVHGRLQRSHLVLELGYARGAVPDVVSHGDAVGPEPIGALDEGGDGVRVGESSAQEWTTLVSPLYCVELAET
ncbi:hypothetical protein B0H14DRAFT_2681714 [Mycena olivaceomarginata]|nr:hypothetical protein B0H14DRAFT_2681714 [Mycena olivaceomarginata]